MFLARSDLISTVLKLPVSTSSPWFSARAKPKPTARNIRVNVTIRVNTKLTAHMSNLKHTTVRKTAPINPTKLPQVHLHFLMILISEVKESGDVESQLGDVLEKEKHQTQTTHAVAETRQRVCHGLENVPFWGIFYLRMLMFPRESPVSAGV